MTWKSTTIDWKNPKTWTLPLSRWLRPHLNARGIRYLRKFGPKDICWDDTLWLEITQSILEFDVDEVIPLLAHAILPASIRTYHGCRTTDAGQYHRRGIQLNDPSVLASELRALVAENEDFAFLRPQN